MDGLMFDTERPYIDLLVKICRERNLNFPTEYVRELIGVSSVTVEKYENNYNSISEYLYIETAWKNRTFLKRRRG